MDGNPQLSQVLAGHMNNPGFSGFGFALPSTNLMKDPAKTAAVNARRRRAYVNNPPSKKKNQATAVPAAAAAASNPAQAAEPATSPTGAEPETSPANLADRLRLTDQERADKDRRNALEFLADKSKTGTSFGSSVSGTLGRGYFKSLDRLKDLPFGTSKAQLVDGIIPAPKRQETEQTVQAPSQTFRTSFTTPPESTGGMNTPASIEEADEAPHMFAVGNRPSQNYSKEPFEVWLEQHRNKSAQKANSMQGTMNLMDQQGGRLPYDLKDQRRAGLVSEMNRAIADARETGQKIDQRQQAQRDEYERRKKITDDLIARGSFEKLADVPRRLSSSSIGRYPKGIIDILLPLITGGEQIKF